MMKNISITIPSDASNVGNPPNHELRRRRSKVKVSSSEDVPQRTTSSCSVRLCGDSPKPWITPTPNTSPVPPTAMNLNKRVPKVLNLSCSLNPISFRHLSLNKRKISSDSLREIHGQSAILHNNSSTCNSASSWSQTRKPGPSSNLGMNNDGLEAIRLIGLDQCFLDGKGFSRMLRQQAHWSSELAQELEQTSATTAPSGPYSSADLVGSYNNDSNRLPSSEELRISNGHSLASRSQSVDLDRQLPGRSKDAKTTVLTNGKVGSFDTDRESDGHHHNNNNNNDLHSNNNNNSISVSGGGVPKEELVLPCANGHRQNYFKPLGMRYNCLTGHSTAASQNTNTSTTSHAATAAATGPRNNAPPPPLLSHRDSSVTNSSPATYSGLREPDDLVAMGSNWNPPPTTQSRSNGRLGVSAYSSQQSQGPPPVAFGSSCPRRLGPKATLGGSGPSKVLKDEPKYADPSIGAPHSIQQRIAEISALESETIRWEKTRRVKKKVS